MLKNCILKTDGRYYFLGRKGRMNTGWVNFNGKRYYASKSGSFLTGIQYVGGKQYLFGKKGVLYTDKWMKKGGKWYYGDKKGLLAKGWKRINDKWYYFTGAGIMHTGWLAENSKFYYLDPKTGEMAVGTKVIDGETYHFSSSGVSDKLPSGSWSIRVNRQANVVTIYKGNVPVKAILCSTGRNNATPLGTFRIMDKLYLHELDGPTWGYYCSHITPDILFHSIPAPSKDRWNVPSYYFNALGTQASAGCIRLAMGDAYWIYTNVPIGTPVTVYDSPDPGPLGKPVGIKMPTYPVYSYDPTDPTR